MMSNRRHNRSSITTMSRMTILMTIFAIVFSTVASNPFSSNVVALTSQNWKEEVLDSPHAVFVNICREG